MNYDELKHAPDKTGWYISIITKAIVDTVIYQHYYYDGPFTDKVSATSELRDMIRDSTPNDLVEYKVEYYNVSIVVDKNAGSWVPRREDYVKD